MKLFLSFWLYQCFGFIAIFTAVFAYCYFFKRQFFRFIWQHLKSIVLILLLVLLAISIACYYHLYHVTYLTDITTPTISVQKN